MSVIDIRDDSVSKPMIIRFGDSDWSAAQFVLSGDYITIKDMDEDETHNINFSDIDNMIKALQKAKEIWT